MREELLSNYDDHLMLKEFYHKNNDMTHSEQERLQYESIKPV